VKNIYLNNVMVLTQLNIFLPRLTRGRNAHANKLHLFVQQSIGGCQYNYMFA